MLMTDDQLGVWRLPSTSVCSRQRKGAGISLHIHRHSLKCCGRASSWQYLNLLNFSSHFKSSKLVNLCIAAPHPGASIYQKRLCGMHRSGHNNEWKDNHRHCGQQAVGSLFSIMKTWNAISIFTYIVTYAALVLHFSSHWDTLRKALF